MFWPRLPKLNRSIRSEIDEHSNSDPPVTKTLEPNQAQKTSEMCVFRALVLLSLCTAAVLCGSISYISLSKLEQRNYNTHYDSVTRQLKQSVEGFVEKYHDAAHELSNLAAVFNPNASAWPNVALPKYYLLDKYSNKVSGGKYSAVIPIVKPEDLAEFEEFSKDVIRNDEYMSSQPQLYSAYGIGVFNISTTGVPGPDTTGAIPGRTRRYLAPALNVGSVLVEAGYLLLNFRTIPFVADSLDDILTCVEDSHSECYGMTDFIGPSHETAVIRPVLSLDGTDTVVGFSTVVFSWEEALSKELPAGMPSLDCVITSSGDTTHTFSLNSKGARHRGQGDLHDKKFSGMASHIHLSSPNSEAELSAVYTFVMYPTDDFMKEYISNTPLYASIGSVSLIIFTSIVFITYDALVKEESRAKINLLNMKRDFVRYISHEIRTPLNTVSVGLGLLEEIILKDRSSYGELLELTRDVQLGSELAVSVLNDLLNFDKLEAGEFQVARAPVKIYSLAETTLKCFKMTALKKEIECTLKFVNEFDKSLYHNSPIVYGDKMKLSQVLRNLISNALKFTDKGGSIDISVTWKQAADCEMFSLNKSNRNNRERPEGYVIVSVQDTGNGISQESLRLLFRDGMQFKANELQAGQGSGLGLFLSYKIIEMHGGRMWATSPGENRGAVFSFQLPTFSSKESVSSKRYSGHKQLQYPLTEEANSLSRISSKSTHGEYLQRKSTIELMSGSPDAIQVPQSDRMSILVVDDTNSNRKMVCRLLSNRGYDFLEARDGRECIDIVTQGIEKVDCILMDYEMPILNGPNAAQQLRNLGYTLPIIGLTGNVMQDDIHHFLNSGADHVLSKPLQLDSFIDIMNEAIV